MATKTETLRNERYVKYVEAVSPKTGLAHSLFFSFVVGGSICLVGQFIFDFFLAVLPVTDKIMLANFTSMTLITVAILLTGLGWYDLFARRGGAGSFLPITGFANAMASASMEFKTEGLTFGTTTKMFSVVGPVIVNGIVWSTVAALITLAVKAIIGGGG